MGGGFNGISSYVPSSVQGSYDLGHYSNTNSQDFTNVQTLIFDERCQSEQHRTNYQKLKYEHTKLKDVYDCLEKELIKTVDTSRSETARHHHEIAEVQKRIRELEGDADQLRQNQLTQERLEALKYQVEEDLDRVYGERFARCDVEAETSRAEHMQCQLEFDYLKSEFGKALSQHEVTVGDFRMRHEAELMNLYEEREEILSKMEPTPEALSSDKLRSLHRENTQLVAQMKTLDSEVAEIKSTIAKASVKNNRGEEIVKEITEILTCCRTDEEEKENLKREVNRLTEALSLTNEELSSEQSHLDHIQKDVNSVQQQLDTAQLKHCSQFNEARLEEMRLKGEVERVRDSLDGQFEDAKFSLERSRECCNQLERAINRAEVEASRKETLAREETRCKLVALEEARSKTESQLASLELRGKRGELETKRQIEALERRQEEAQSAQSTAQQECAQLGARMDAVVDSELRSVSHKAISARESAALEEARLSEAYTRLAELERLHEEAQQLMKEAARLRSREGERVAQKESVSADRFAEWQLTRREIEQRVEELEREVVAASKEKEKLDDDLMTKKKKWKRYFFKQKERLELVEATLSKEETENRKLRQSIHPDEFRRRSRELRDLTRRERDFRHVLLSPVTYPIPLHRSPQEEERYHQEELRRTREICDLLEGRTRGAEAQNSLV